MAGRLVAIYTAAARREQMVAHDECRVVAGEGLAGDRYATKQGRYSGREGRGREITLIEHEAIVAANEQGVTIGAHETRRNLVTEGLDLDRLVGKTFRVGEVVLIGVRDCPPCAYLEQLTRPGVRAALEGRGGLRADVVHEGIVRVGDGIEEVDPASVGLARPV